MGMSKTHSPLSRQEQALLKAALPALSKGGFSDTALKVAARHLGLSDGVLDLLCPNGALDLLSLYWRGANSALLAIDLNGLKIRQKIETLLNGWIDHLFAHPTVARSALGQLALPHHLALGSRLLWESADQIWILAGDQALDENHYSKRTIVSGILSTASLTRLSRGREAQIEQISRNINAVMDFEKFKAGLPTTPEKLLFEAFGALGQMRFGKA